MEEKNEQPIEQPVEKPEVKKRFDFRKWLEGNNRREYVENISFVIIVISGILVALGIGLTYRKMSIGIPPALPPELPPHIARPRTRELRGLETQIKRIRKQLVEKPVPVTKKPKIKRKVKKVEPKPKKRFKKLKPKDIRKYEAKLKRIQQGISEEVSKKYVPHAKKPTIRRVKVKKRRVRKTYI